MNSFTIALWALCAGTQGLADEPAVILVRDGGRSMSEVERRLLMNPTPADLRQLESDGYLSVQLEGAAVLMIDPLAPPIGEMFQTRVLLEAMGEIGETKRFGDLSPETKRVISSLAAKFGQPVVLSEDTAIGTGSSATFEFRLGDKTLSRALPLESGKGSRSDMLAALTQSPATAKQNSTGAAAATMGDGLSRCEILLSESWKRSSRSVDLFRMATEELNRLASEERRKRDAAVSKMIASLLDANPNLPGAPNDAWSKDMIPDSMAKTMEESFRSSWKALGFDSSDAAVAAFSNGSLSGAGIRFELSFGVSGMQSTNPVVATIVFGNTAR